MTNNNLNAYLNDLDVTYIKTNYKWIINSTGSNTGGTTFSADLEGYLLNKGFTKIFSGNPMYATNIDYTEDDIRGICNFIMNMRKDYGQNIGQIQCSYMPTSSLVSLRYDCNDKK